MVDSLIIPENNTWLCGNIKFISGVYQGISETRVGYFMSEQS